MRGQSGYAMQGTGPKVSCHSIRRQTHHCQTIQCYTASTKIPAFLFRESSARPPIDDAYEPPELS